MRKLILITGMPGSGKSIVSSYFKSRGYTVYSMGDIVRNIAEERGVEKTLENLLSIAQEIRNKYGPSGVAKLMIPILEKEKSETVVIDGVRSINEIGEFKKVSKCINIIAVYSPPYMRFERLLYRGRPGDPRSFEELIERDLKELSFGIGNVISLSDFMIINDESPSKVIDYLKSKEDEICNCKKESVWKYL
ncbi:AAA family ATPase [Fervidicoccus fontis]|nr:AAA family ATPase [Fervidicoccus fontis]MBE9390510.1 AAA family ATPase [Fervidicoccus fontis]PMB75861.1 MAG: dephospho-CoA kinase [Fervidicoccus fontis]PMB77740.1 MAG: dephospho-CoA kinase [Fervidicoccus fontis]HEW64282.1 dephospho-CoA kinase [Fervidicoccus fontis]